MTEFHMKLKSVELYISIQDWNSSLDWTWNIFFCRINVFVCLFFYFCWIDGITLLLFQLYCLLLYFASSSSFMTQFWPSCRCQRASHLTIELEGVLVNWLQKWSLLHSLLDSWCKVFVRCHSTCLYWSCLGRTAVAWMVDFLISLYIPVVDLWPI